MNIIVKSIKKTSPSTLGFINVLALACLALMVSLFSSQSAHAIKKCKDSDGRWHYGDVAVRACEDSKITTLSGKGFVENEKAAPKTEEELAAEAAARAEIEAEMKRKGDLEREKTRILSVYETEADIDRQRDNQLYSVDSNIAVHDTFLESMKELIAHEEKKRDSAKNSVLKELSEKKITEAEENYKTYSNEVVSLKAQREQIIEKFKREKLVYRELTQSVDE